MCSMKLLLNIPHKKNGQMKCLQNLVVHSLGKRVVSSSRSCLFPVRVSNLQVTTGTRNIGPQSWYEPSTHTPGLVLGLFTSTHVHTHSNLQVTTGTRNIGPQSWYEPSTHAPGLVLGLFTSTHVHTHRSSQPRCSCTDHDQCRGLLIFKGIHQCQHDGVSVGSGV
jgi:hypothetical protein